MLDDSLSKPKNTLTHRLIATAYGGRMMEHQNLALELPVRLGLETGCEHDHALAYFIAFDLEKRIKKLSKKIKNSHLANLFQSKRSGLPASHLLDGQPLPVDRFHCSGHKVPGQIGTQHEHIVHLNDALVGEATYHCADALQEK